MRNSKNIINVFYTFSFIFLMNLNHSSAQERLWDSTGLNVGNAPSVSLPRTSGVPVGNSNYSNQPAQATVPAAPVTTPNRIINTNTPQNTPKNEVKDTKASTAKVEPKRNTNLTVKPTVDLKYFKGMTLSGTAQVIDGHSLIIGEHPVRLNGIEAPGLAQMCNTSTMTTWACGTKSAQRLNQLINNDKVTCTVESQAGHGAAAVCGTRNIKDLGNMLVSEGWAVPNRYGLKYSSVSANASNSRKGLFIGSFTNPIKWRKQQNP